MLVLSKPKRLLLLIFFCFIAKGSLFSQGINWYCATDSAEWHPRAAHASIAFDNKMWVMRGYYSEDNYIYLLNDVWHSIDGVNWTQATDSAAWPAMSGPPVVFNDKMWVLAGPHVYHSIDGSNWDLATISGPWPLRNAHSTMVFNDKIWVTGGRTVNLTCLNDVWNSTDGINWVCVVDSAGWEPRLDHISVVFDNKMWILGGFHEEEDIWYSTDGVSWACATNSAEWSPRWGFSCVVCDNKMWVIGGMRGNNLLNDVWCSIDGINWICVTDSAKWRPRYGHTSIVFDDKIWVIGGADTTVYFNDVWYSGIEGVAEKEITSTETYLVILPAIAKEHVKIKYKAGNRGNIKIYNMTGRIVKNFNFCEEEDKINWDLKDNYGKKLGRGIYFIHLKTQNVRKHAKLIII